MKLGRINHIGLITESMDRSLAFYRDVMGAQVIHPPFEMGGPDGASICFIETGNSQLELIQPLTPASPFHQFLADYPTGKQHHICYEVPDIHEAKSYFESKGCRILFGPMIGAHGTMIFFVHPDDMDGVLTEFLEPHGGPNDPNKGHEA
jgi:methylmalonyl-CoA/ethylmalonyl-CoA epimerase